MRVRQGLAGVVLAGLLAGCGLLPAEGPTLAVVANSQVDPTGIPSYRVIDLEETILAVINSTAPASFAGVLYAGKAASLDRIGPGDVLGISIYEAAQGGLFSGTITAVSGTPADTLPRVLVDGTGLISVPYAGTMQAAGRTARELSLEIERRLRDKAIEPQVLVSVVTNVANTFTVTGDIRTPGRLPLSATKEKVLDGLALAGGAAKPAHDTFVQLTRKRKIAKVLLKRIIDTPSEDIFLWPGDQLHVTYEPRTFTVFGAAQNSSQFPFDTDRLSLLEALGRAGGLVDLQSDASAVFVFRYEVPHLAHKIGIDVPVAPNGGVPVVYRLNLLAPKGYFFGQSFMIREKDVIYVATAPSVELQKFISLIRAGTSAGGTVTTIQRIGQ